MPWRVGKLDYRLPLVGNAIRVDLIDHNIKEILEFWSEIICVRIIIIIVADVIAEHQPQLLEISGA
ncbi:MAG: hypothetical protein WCS96_06610 [Victivallales bacterium]